MSSPSLSATARPARSCSKVITLVEDQGAQDGAERGSVRKRKRTPPARPKKATAFTAEQPNVSAGGLSGWLLRQGGARNEPPAPVAQQLLLRRHCQQNS